MLARLYAQALLGALEGKKSETAFSNFTKLLKEKGHLKLLPSIKRELERLFKERERKEKVTLFVGEKVSSKEKETILKQFEGVAGKITTLEECLDESLIGGAKIKGRGFRIDGSYKNKLTTLYQSIIRNS